MFGIALIIEIYHYHHQHVSKKAFLMGAGASNPIESPKVRRRSRGVLRLSPNIGVALMMGFLASVQILRTIVYTRAILRGTSGGGARL